jgi:chorismate synthase
VAAGAIAKKLLSRLGVSIVAFTKQVGDMRVEDSEVDFAQIEINPVRAPNREKALAMEDLILRVQEEGDSIGGVVETVARGVPAGWGEPVFDKLSADLAKAVMSIGAVKGVEMGAGFAVAAMRGSQANDGMNAKGFMSNRAGGVLGGISTGQEIVLRAAFKPTPSIALPQAAVDEAGKEVKLRLKGRFDPCVCPRAVPVVEAMVALTLANHCLRQAAQSRL